MITEDDLNKAIEACQGQRHPNANTCIKLASYLIIRDALYGEEEPSYSYRSLKYSSKSDFYRLARKTDSEYLLAVMDELMEILKDTQPRLYNSTMQKMEA